MTLSVALKRHGRVITMSDIMASNKVGNKAVSLPTTGKNAGPYYDGYFLSSLIQKTYILNDCLLFMFSGNVRQAAIALKCLQEAVQKEPITHELVHKTYFGIPESNRNDVEIFIACIDITTSDEAGLFTVAARSVHYEIPPFDEVVTLGSGNPDFHQSLEVAFRGEDLSTVNSVDTLDYALSFMSMAMQRQERSNYGTANAWGGGAQISRINGEKFELLNNILVRRWFLKARDNGVELVPDGNQYLMSYIDDLLICCVKSTSNEVRLTRVGSIIKPTPNAAILTTLRPEFIIDTFDLSSIVSGASTTPGEEPVLSYVTFGEEASTADEWTLNETGIIVAEDVEHINSKFHEIMAGLDGSAQSLHHRRPCSIVACWRTINQSPIAGLVSARAVAEAAVAMDAADPAIAILLDEATLPESN